MNSQTMYARFLRYGILGGIFLVPFIPFLVSSAFFFPFITTKNFTFRILVEIIFALWVILVLIDRSYLPKRSWLLVGVGAFVGIIAVADVFGVYPYKSIWSNFERMEGLVTLLHLLAYTVVTAAMLRSERLWNYLFHTSIGVSVLIGVYGVIQLMGLAQIHQGGVRLDASLGNATYLAVYMLVHMFLAAYYLLRLVEREGDQIGKLQSFYWKIVFYASIIAFQFFILYHTATRGALIGLFAGALVTAGLVGFFEKNKTVLKKTALGIIIAVFVVIGGFLLIKNTDFVQKSQVLSRFSSISLSETTTKSRFLIWNMALQGAKERPILGWGQENFNYVFNKYYSPQMYNQEQWFDRTHNVILDWLIAGGILGLLSYLGLFGLLFYYFWFVKRSDDSVTKIGVEARQSFSLLEKSVLSGLLVAYFTHNLFVFDNLVSYILFFTIIAYVAERTGTERFTDKTIVRNEAVSSAGAQYAFIPVVILLVTFLFYVVNVPALKTATGLIVALKPQSQPEKNLEMVRGVIDNHSFGTTEAREQLVQLTFQVLGASGVSNEVKQKFAQYTSDQMKEQLVATPNDARYLLFYGIFLSQLGSADAMQYLMKAHEKSPNKQTIYFEIVSDYLRKKEYNQALAYAKEAYDLAPMYDEAIKIYALVAVYAGQPELSAKLIMELPVEERALDDRFIQAYSAVKQYDRVLAMLQDRAAKDPNNYQTHLGLAQTYFSLGYVEQSIKEIQTAEVLNPAIKPQMDQLISDIRAGKVKL